MEPETPKHDDGRGNDDAGSFEDLSARIGAIDGLPSEAVRPLAVLIRSSGVDTGAQLSEIRRTVRHGLHELLNILDQRNETSTDEANRARALLESISVAPSSVVRRIDIVAPAIATLRACGCSMKDAATYTAELYPIAGWRIVEPKTILELFYDKAPAELRGDQNEHHERIRAELESRADEVELYGASQPDLR